MNLTNISEPYHNDFKCSEYCYCDRPEGKNYCTKCGSKNSECAMWTLIWRWKFGETESFYCEKCYEKISNDPSMINIIKTIELNNEVEVQNFKGNLS